MGTLGLHTIDFALVLDDKDGVFEFGSNLYLSNFAFIEIVVGLDGDQLLGEDFLGGVPEGVGGGGEGGEGEFGELGFEEGCVFGEDGGELEEGSNQLHI